MCGNKPDFLAECAAAATRMGMTYGKYMAMRYNRGCVSNPYRVQEAEPDAVCKCCGKPFVSSPRYRVYCSLECKYEGDLKLRREKYSE